MSVFDFDVLPNTKVSPVWLAAIDLAQAGIPIFPCGEDKRPLTPNGFRDASTEYSTVDVMFSNPRAKFIGMPTGAASGLIALDADRHHADKDGVVWLESNENRLPRTRTHRTIGGGYHLIFRAPDGVMVRNRAAMVPGVHVRGEGGYVIVPPSAGYEVVDFAEPAEMPGWLIAACLDKARTSAPSQASEAASGGLSRWADTALNAEIGRLYQAPEGQRNDALNTCAYSLGQIVGGGELDRGTVETALRNAGRTIGLADREIEATIRSGIGSGMLQHRQKPEREDARRADASLPDGDELADALSAAAWASTPSRS